MRVEYVMVADAAQVTGGKLYVLGGGWNQYRAASFPAPSLRSRTDPAANEARSLPFSIKFESLMVSCQNQRFLRLSPILGWVSMHR